MLNDDLVAVTGSVQSDSEVLRTDYHAWDRLRDVLQIDGHVMVANDIYQVYACIHDVLECVSYIFIVLDVLPVEVPPVSFDKGERQEPFIKDITVKHYFPNIHSYTAYIYLPATDYNMCMLSSDYDYANLGESKPMGTGPFMSSQYIPKESIAMVKNPNYWDPTLPKADKILIYFVADSEASISMLEADKVDIVIYVTSIIRDRLEKSDKYTVITPYQEQRLISLNVDEKPWDDNRVRKLSNML